LGRRGRRRGLCGRLGAGFGLSSWRVWRWRWRGLGWRAEAGTDGFAPGFGAPGLNVFVAGVLDGLHEGLAKVGDDGACLGFIWPCAVAARVRASAMLRLVAETHSPENAEEMLRPIFAWRSPRLRGGRGNCRDRGRRREAYGSGGRRCKRTDTRTRRPWRDV
jgi:hypothetical protein